ncbi:FliC/FljB family flagellin [Xenorhabdus sp. PB62.4]|uniref:FliC/FljB family flagellin n=1 Tax=Xenorhabdus sp. PB62.4 TaxID=1851573 RepID=UPI0016574ED8|nr:FliC/FljB family flagellin [Xenorhabdus sp. PB62.4]MBC8953534.1 flagellin [Xenorhabdus sp. PB62.4]
MASVINTNYSSLLAQNNLTRSKGALGTAIERLSSGLRINSAKDDAAGQAIANRFAANVKGLSQASRNANDGISIAQTTEGALNEINSNLQRIRELAVQSQNGSNSKSDLGSIQKEVKQRLDEIDRISAQTQFNGIKVLNGDTTMKVQVGANDNETIEIDLKKIDSNVLSLKDFNVTPTLKKENELKGTSVDIPGGDTGVNIDAKVKEAGDARNLTDAKLHKVSDGKGVVDGQYVIEAKDAGGKIKLFDATVAKDGTVTIGSETKESDQTKDPLKTLDAALSKVDDLRSTLGAVQNRLESTVNNLNNTVNNLSAAKSRIEDADYATEVSNMSRGNILQQAGTAVLAQANQIPQTVMSLLR